MTDTEAMLEDCNKRYQKLSDWERSFIDKLFEIPTSNIIEKQYETLEKIWDRIT
jgi:hypothetical protein